MKHYQRVSFIILVGMNLLFTNFVMAQEPVIEKEYILEKKQRVTRTEFDFSYRVKIINNGDAIKNVSATVSSNSVNTSVIDGNVNFSDLSAGAFGESIDSFTIRQNRRHKFEPNSLVWDVQYELVNDDGLPPDPGAEGLLTIKGIDSDNDGVRDDVQIEIAKKYPSNDSAKLALTQFAKSLQRAFIAKNNDNEQQLNAIFSEIISASTCITFSTPNPREDILFIEMIMENTGDRSEIHRGVNAAASGQFFGGEVNPDTACQQ